MKKEITVKAAKPAVKKEVKKATTKATTDKVTPVKKAKPESKWKESVSINPLDDAKSIVLINDELLMNLMMVHLRSYLLWLKN